MAIRNDYGQNQYFNPNRFLRHVAKGKIEDGAFYYNKKTGEAMTYNSFGGVSYYNGAQNKGWNA